MLRGSRISSFECEKAQLWDKKATNTAKVWCQKYDVCYEQIKAWISNDQLKNLIINLIKLTEWCYVVFVGLRESSFLISMIFRLLLVVFFFSHWVIYGSLHTTPQRKLKTAPKRASNVLPPLYSLGIWNPTITGHSVFQKKLCKGNDMII